jgi:uncharacterized small protein (DUF1192 family)
MSLCPITHDVMTDPVMDREGNTYERSAIERWLLTHNTSPITRNPLHSHHLVPNRALLASIAENAKMLADLAWWQEDNFELKDTCSWLEQELEKEQEDSHEIQGWLAEEQQELEKEQEDCREMAEWHAEEQAKNASLRKDNLELKKQCQQWSGRVGGLTKCINRLKAQLARALHHPIPLKEKIGYTSLL